MGIIRRKVWLSGLKGRVQVNALFDTGSTDSLVREDLAGKIGPFSELEEPKTFHAIRDTFKVREAIFAGLKIGRHKMGVAPAIVAGLTEELIIGTDVMQRYNIKLEPKRHRIILDPEALVHRA